MAPDIRQGFRERWTARIWQSDLIVVEDTS
jgi:hypothetical protein